MEICVIKHPKKLKFMKKYTSLERQVSWSPFANPVQTSPETHRSDFVRILHPNEILQRICGNIFLYLYISPYQILSNPFQTTKMPDRIQ